MDARSRTSRSRSRCSGCRRASFARASARRSSASGLAGRGDSPAGVLSGGEQQRVAVARAIVGEPALILADEPTGNLDPQLAIDVLGLFEEIHESGTTVVFATHDRTLLEVRPRRIVVLDEGKAIDVPQGIASEEYDNRLPL